jgi:hypothetical protein
MCNELEQATSLDRLEARGTVRLTLRQAGLEARSVNSEQLAVVIERLLPAELRARGIDEPELCAEFSRALQSVEVASAAHEAPEEVFRRLGN